VNVQKKKKRKHDQLRRKVTRGKKITAENPETPALGQQQRGQEGGSGGRPPKEFSSSKTKKKKEKGSEP